MSEPAGRAVGVTLVEGEVLATLRTLPSESFDGLFCDPPYGLGLTSWDGEMPGVEVWAECQRLLRPGSWVLAFGGRRTHHRLMTSMEQAGLEIHDVLSWIYGTGMPKGGRSSLKPAWEPAVLARRAGPRQPLNLDACRLQGPVLSSDRRTSPRGRKTAWGGTGKLRRGERHHPKGRWPTNALFGHRPGCRPEACLPGCPVQQLRERARFFYCPKPVGREARGNRHPTKKPLHLTTYLSQLILPPRAGRLLVPYCGSGSEVLGALRAGWPEVLGIEQDPEWLAVAEQRLAEELSLTAGESRAPPGPR
jgi:site-specific DNA-methyltransferase (adenine-specific)